VRYWGFFLSMNVAVCLAADATAGAAVAARAASDGRALFAVCEFKGATRAFEQALSREPESAQLHYWLGKSYARLAEVSSPLLAPKRARKARGNLEDAVRLDPQNREYLEELFDFYLDSPEWLQGGLKQAAAMVDRIGPEGSGREERLQRLSESRKDHSGPGWWMRRAVLWTSGAMGRVVPQP
jgi:tetratricopeptide (TPR) repeat protein